jgi:hypothetical protein
MPGIDGTTPPERDAAVSEQLPIRSGTPEQPARPPEAVEDEQLPPIEVPAIIAEAHRVFLAELPQLLKERQGRWVAYHGATRLGDSTPVAT